MDQSGYCNRCGAKMPPDVFRSWCPPCHAEVVAEIRAREALPAGGSPPPGDGYATTLHLGFLTLEETDEMRALAARDWYQFEPREARSKIGRTNLKEVRPVDGTAGRVL